jgi:hypothetical protein
MFDEDFSRTCDLVDSGAATARVVLEETGHGIDCFSTLGEDFEESVFDLDVCLGGAGVGEGGKFG